jgi:hypothetical protein
MFVRWLNCRVLMGQANHSPLWGRVFVAEPFNPALLRYSKWLTAVRSSLVQRKPRWRTIEVDAPVATRRGMQRNRSNTWPQHLPCSQQ